MELACFFASSVAGALISSLHLGTLSKCVPFLLFPPPSLPATSPTHSLARLLDPAHEDSLPEDRLEAGNWMVRV